MSNMLIKQHRAGLITEIIFVGPFYKVMVMVNIHLYSSFKAQDIENVIFSGSF